MATVIGNMLMALMMVLGGSAGVVALDDARHSDAPTIEERLNKKSEKLEMKLELVEACRSWENCSVDSTSLDEYDTHISERLQVIDACLADYDNCTLDDLRKDRNSTHENMTFAQKVENKTAHVADWQMMVEACRNIADCDVDEENLDHFAEKLDKKSERLEKCSADLEECEEKSKHKKHKRAKKMRKHMHRR